jgi:hypothetical protein
MNLKNRRKRERKVETGRSRIERRSERRRERLNTIERYAGVCDGFESW